MDQKERRPWPNLAWPIILIGAGVILLLSNIGVLPQNSWGLIWRLWPLALIVLGIDLLIGRRSRAGQLLSALLALALIGAVIALLLASPNIPALRQIETQSELQSTAIETPLENIETADLEIDWGSSESRLGALTGESDQLLHGDIQHYGELVFNVQTRATRSLVTIDTRQVNFFNLPDFSERTSWQIDLHPSVRYHLNLDQGSGSARLELGELALDGLVLDGGSGQIEIWLPEGIYPVDIDQGSGSLQVHLPAGSGVRLRLDQGSGNFSPSGALIELDDDLWETPDYDQASQQIDITIDQGSGNLLLSQP